VVIQPDDASALSSKLKPQGFYQVQLQPVLAHNGDDIAGVGRDFRFEQGDMEAWRALRIGMTSRSLGARSVKRQVA